MNQPKVAVIGCGYWGRNIVRNFSNLGELRMIHDPSPLIAREISDRHGVPAVDLDLVLSDNGVKGVAIAAPAPLHFELASLCLNAGKHVMVEKPVALNRQDAIKLIELADKQSRLLMVGHLLNYHNGFLKVCELVDRGEIGKLRRIYSNRLSFGKVRTEEDVLWSFAPHDISMILRLVDGETPDFVEAHGGAYITANTADFAHVHLGFANNVTAHVFVSWLHPFKEQRLVVVGESGMIVFDDTAPIENKVAIYRHKVELNNGIPVMDRAEAEYPPIPICEPLQAECQAFLSGMENPSDIYTDGAEGLRVLEVLTRAQSAMSGPESLMESRHAD